MRDQDATDPRDVIARVEGVPLTAEEGLEPGAEVHGCVGRWYADIAEIPSAIARGDIHAATESDRQVGEISTDTLALAIRLPCGSRFSRVLVAELDVLMDEITDGLDAAPAGGRLVEQRPGRLRKAVGLAIATPQQVHQSLFGQVVDRVLLCPLFDLVGRPWVADDRISPEMNFPFRSDDPAAPVAKPVAVCLDRGGQFDDECVGSKQVGDASIVNAQRQDHGSGFRAIVNDVVTNTEFHV